MGALLSDFDRAQCAFCCCADKTFEFLTLPILSLLLLLYNFIFLEAAINEMNFKVALVIMNLVRYIDMLLSLMQFVRR